MLFRHMTFTALMLGAFAIIATTVVSLVNWQTQPRIAENERRAIMENLNSLVPATQYDNDLVNDTLAVTDPLLLGSKKPLTVYRARRNGQPVAAVFTVIAPDGYNGAIKLLVAIHYDGIIAGVRVVGHKETPGLGDAIDVDRSDWVFSFNGRSLSNPTVKGWHVKKDGGVFDQFTGATITPRAIVKAVYNSLKYFSAHRDQVFANPTPTTAEEDS